MNNAICKKGEVVIYTNDVIEIEGIVSCTEDKCVNSNRNIIEDSDQMSWSDFLDKHDRYE